MELMQCTRCGQFLPRSKLERMKTGTYRRVCNHCKWLYYVKPSRDRRILRELEQRQKVTFHLPKSNESPCEKLLFKRRIIEISPKTCKESN